jgi:thiol:disulfide interchange protein DsbD
MAARGQYFYPIVGMLTFSTVLALPFFLLALAPGLLSRMPRSGDWMNAVKVVGGLVEIGAAFKFVNTAEIGFGATPSNAWFDARVVLAIWIVMLLVCGIYLLGLFRTDHDHEAIKVGPVRLLCGTLFLGLALYLSPALFGTPPRSKVYESIVGILPPDAVELDSTLTLKQEFAKFAARAAGPAPVALASSSTSRADTGPRKATSKDPKQAVLEEKTFHGVQWGLSYEAALAEAKKSDRPVLVDFTGVFCTNCRTMEQTVFTRPDVIAEFHHFVPVQQFTDQVPIDTITVDQREELAAANGEREIELIDQTTLPYYAVLTPEGTVIASTKFDPSAEGFRNFLQQARAKFQKSRPEKVAGMN